MASTDARPIPLKNTAMRITFPLRDANGDLVTGATSLDSEYSLDAAAFGDCASEATEIATASGIYYLDLTAGEMNGDTVAVIVKSANAKTFAITMYPDSGGDFTVNVGYWNGTAVASPATAGIPDVNVKNIDNDAASASGTVTFPNATLASTTNITAGTVTTATNVTTVNGLAANVITATSIAADAITAAKIADGAIDAATLATGTITAAKFAASAIDAAAIADGAIDAATFATDAISAASVSAGAVTKIQAGLPTAAQNATAVLTTAITESYSASGAAPTLAQAMFLTLQRVYNFAISGTSITVKKLDGSTTAAVLTIDSSTAPTSSTRSS